MRSSLLRKQTGQVNADANVILLALSSVHVAKRENAIVNRLNKTKVEKKVDHEQERVDRIKQETAVKRAAANERVRITTFPPLLGGSPRRHGPTAKGGTGTYEDP